MYTSCFFGEEKEQRIIPYRCVKKKGVPKSDNSVHLLKIIVLGIYLER